MRRGPSPFGTACRAALVALACASPNATGGGGSASDADAFLVVDCLLPGQIRRLGTGAVYATPRRPVKTSARECEIRGGEYVAWDRADLGSSLRIWLAAAQDGDPVAQTYVGEMYEKGLGVDPDHATAARWYRLAADQGFARAQVNLAHLYDRGLGVPRDPERAMAWYRAASALPEAGLAFVPSAPPGEETAALQDQVEAREEETLRLRAELERLRRELLEAQGRASHEEQALAAEREALGARAEQLSRRERELAARLAALDAERRQREPPAEPAPLPAPEIQVLEPPLEATREAVGRVVARAGEQLVVGRVASSAGLLALTVNGRATAVDERGLFQIPVQVPDEGLRVSIAAIDRRGQRSERSFRFEAEGGSPTTPEAAPAAPARMALPTDLDFGRYVALVIGNDAYRHLPRLQTAVADARAVARVLERRYGFEVKLLENADRYAILSALNELRGRLTEGHNLLVYYAGHGELDRANARGHWLPVDAEPDSTANWISNVAVTDVLNAMAARHVLVVADSCYSGTLTRASLARLDPGMSEEARIAWIRALLSKRSRTALTSGGLEPVLDEGGGGHSVFARRFLDVLEANEDVLEAQRLYQAVSARVTHDAANIRFDQVPQYAPIQFAGHESGDFFFVPGS
jgi:uncharacterized caspase-like protein